MKSHKIVNQIKGSPVWALSLTAAIISAFIIGFLNSYIDSPVIYIIWMALIIVSTFLICILIPSGVWKVPLICNSLDILPAIFNNSFWTTSFGLIVGIGIIISFISAFWGSYLGKKMITTVKNDLLNQIYIFF